MAVHLLEYHATKVIAILLIVIVLLSLCEAIYNVYLHPLSKYPGPVLAKVSHIWYAFHWLSGRYPYDIANLHKKYGNVIRIAPNELSFSSIQSQKDIHSHAGKDKQTFLKSNWYDTIDNNPGIAFIREPSHHREVRRQLSHAFSAVALREQTAVVEGYVELFAKQLSKFATGEQGIDVNAWFNWLTFDIIGDLSFGQSFGATANAKGHFWIDMIFEGIFAQALQDVFHRLPWLRLFSRVFVDEKHLLASRKKHRALTNERIKARMENTKLNNRQDFFSHLLKKRDPTSSDKFFEVNSSTLIVAGSDTTSTFLTGVTFYLLKNPQTFERLAKEVRSTFASTNEITADSTTTLEYVSAVVEEGLRIFPPAASGFPRYSPGAVVDGHYIPKGTTVSVASWALSHSDQYFHDPHGFRPERWLSPDHKYYDAAFSNDQKDASKPFSSGPRACIGINLAYLEMKYILTRIFYQYDMELLSKEVDWYRDTKMLLLWRKPELRVRFHEVKKV